MIALEAISKSYHLGGKPYPVLKEIDLTIAAGERVAIMGPSGAGKSTLMNILGLLDRPTGGRYLLNDRDVSTLGADERAEVRNHNVGFVFQSFFLLPLLTALQNVALPLAYRDTKPDEGRRRALAALRRVGMADFSTHRPLELSGGQQQRVAIARAIIGDPSIVLADEPTGALDSKTGQDIMDLLIGLNQTEKATVVIVTHDPHIGGQCPRIISIEDGRVAAGN